MNLILSMRNQPACPRSLVSVFDTRCLNKIIKLAKVKFPVAEQAGLNLT